MIFYYFINLYLIYSTLLVNLNYYSFNLNFKTPNFLFSFFFSSIYLFRFIIIIVICIYIEFFIKVIYNLRSIIVFFYNIMLFLSKIKILCIQFAFTFLIYFFNSIIFIIIIVIRFLCLLIFLQFL